MTYPKLPPIPPGPDPTTVSMPPASPLPAGARTLALPTSSWVPDIGDLATSPGAVWVSSGVFGIDPATDAVTGPLTTHASQDIGYGEGSVWAADYDNNLVRRFDPATGNQLAVVPGISTPEGIVDAGGAIWVASHHGGTLARIDTGTNHVTKKVILVPPGPSGPQGMAAGFGSVWVDVPSAYAVFRIDPATAKITAIVRLPTSTAPCGGIAVGATAVWVTSCLTGNLVARIDPATNTVASILDVGGEVIQPAVDGNTVWFVAGGDPDGDPVPGYLIQLGANDIVATRIALPAGFVSGGTALAFGSVWVSDFVHPRVIRVPGH
ncbi:MAG: Vgb family protein [Gaiellaceae bacterium]